MKFKLALACLVLGALVCVTACTEKTGYQTTEGATHTYYRMKYLYDKPLDNEIRQLIEVYHHAINPFDSTSVISAVNRNTCLKTDTLFARAFCSAAEIYVQTDGMFDPTCAPFINYWGFGFENMDSIPLQGIDSLKQFVGFDKISLRGDSVIKTDNRVMLNFSAIGDGYLCDLIAELFESKGIKDYLVDVGGEMVASGVNPNGKPWTVGINKPVDDSVGINREIQQIIKIPRKMGVATSGNYRNFYIKNGKKYAHTINPKTGFPAQSDILSATVLAPTATLADGLATAFMAMGRQKASQFVRNRPELACYFIYEDENGNFACEYSDNMKQYLK